MNFVKPTIIFGIHAVEEALGAGRTIDKVLVKKGASGPQLSNIIATMRKIGIQVQQVPIEKLNRLTQKNHQGIIAFPSAIDYTDLTMLVPTLFERGKSPLLLALDGVTDIRNFGAVARTAECAGVDALVIPARESVSVNDGAMSTSAGALNHIPVCRETSFQQALHYLRDSGFSIIGATEKGDTPLYSVDFKVPTVVVMGAEDSGLSEQSLRQADLLVKIPVFGQVNSLNVSVAAAIVIYEAVRQRNSHQGE